MLYDCIVIGGGPAGSICSFILQTHGISCLLLEKRPFIDEKVCGGFLPNRCRELIMECGIDLRELALSSNIIQQYTEIRNDTVKQYSYPKGKFGIGTFRKDLDSFLLQQAASRGTEIVYGQPVQTYETEQGIYKINGYYGKRMIWATGASSPVGLKCVSREKVSEKLRRQTLGISEIVRIKQNSLQNKSVYFWYTDFTNDYFWAIPIANDVWNIGYWSQREKKDLKKKFETGRKRWIEGICEDIQIIRPAKGAILGNENFSDCFLGEPAVCCGDLAGSNNFSTGEGIAQAVISAKLTAEMIIHSLKGEP